VFLTRSPLRCPKAPPFDLHALGTPPAFILSQDQTLSPIFLIPIAEDSSSGISCALARTTPSLGLILRVAHPSPAPLCCQSALPASPDGKSDSTPARCRCQGLVWVQQGLCVLREWEAEEGKEGIGVTAVVA